MASATSEEDPLGAAGEVPAAAARTETQLIVVQEQMGALEHLQDLFLILLRSPPWVFACAVVLAPFLCAFIFTPLYLLDLRGLIVDDSVVRAFKQSTKLMAPFPRLEAPSLKDDGTDATTLEEVGEGLADPRVWLEVYGFCLGLQTGLEQKLYPNSWYSMGLANVNALSAQLLVVLMTGTVFARLSQPATPIRCSSVALVSRPLEIPPGEVPGSTGEQPGGAAVGAGGAAAASPQGSLESSVGAWSPSNDLQCSKQQQGLCRMLLVRYVLAGPQPMELVDLRIELSLREDSTTHSGSFFRRVTSLHLLRSTSAYQKYGMLIRHPINEGSPLFGRTQRDLEACNAELALCIMGLERASMQPVFQIQHYFARDGDIVWGAEFEDMVSTEGADTRVMDQRKLNSWKPCPDRSSSTASGKK